MRNPTPRRRAASSTIERPVAEMSDAEVDEEVTKLAESARTFSPKTGSAETGDRMTVAYAGKVDGEPFPGGTDDNATIRLGTSQFIPGGTREQHHWFNELERISTSPANAARMMRVFDSIDVVGQLAGVSCPSIVLHSTHDLRVPFAEGRLIAGAIPQARFVPLDSSNHLVLRDEACWEQWHREVDDFLHTLSSRSAGAMFAALTARLETSDWGHGILRTLRRQCPLSMACTLELVRAARRDPGVEKALAREYRFTSRAASDGELLEGIRAAVIDKDRNPVWRDDMDSLRPEEVAAMLAPLGADELRL